MIDYRTEVVACCAVLKVSKCVAMGQPPHARRSIAASSIATPVAGQIETEDRHALRYEAPADPAPLWRPWAICSGQES